MYIGLCSVDGQTARGHDKWLPKRTREEAVVLHNKHASKEFSTNTRKGRRKREIQREREQKKENLDSKLEM